MVVTGDPTQVDLPNNMTSGLTDALGILKGVKGISQVHFQAEDIVRHALVGRIVQAYEKQTAKPKPVAMNLSIDVEDDSWRKLADVETIVSRAVHAVLPDDGRSMDVVLTSDAEIQLINKEWRGFDKPTNVLSFPSPEMPVPAGEVAHLGDLVLAYETMVREATEAGKPLAEHVTHLVVHGTLHLLGHDHEDDAEADEMEAEGTGDSGRPWHCRSLRSMSNDKSIENKARAEFSQPPETQAGRQQGLARRPRKRD